MVSSMYRHIWGCNVQPQHVWRSPIRVIIWHGPRMSTAVMMHTWLNNVAEMLRLMYAGHRRHGGNDRLPACPQSSATAGARRARGTRHERGGLGASLFRLGNEALTCKPLSLKLYLGVCCHEGASSTRVHGLACN